MNDDAGATPIGASGTSSPRWSSVPVRLTLNACSMPSNVDVRGSQASRSISSIDAIAAPPLGQGAGQSISLSIAADQIVEKGRCIAAGMLEVSEADVEFAGPHFVVKGTDRSVELFEVAAAASGDAVPLELRGSLTGVADQVMSIPSYAYTCAVCEVEIDPETGLVEVVGYVSIDDCGRAMNPMLIHGQSHGGIAQGIGQALRRNASMTATRPSFCPAR